MRSTERCKACNAQHEHKAGERQSNVTLFKHKYVSVCTACGASGEQDELEEYVWYCEVCDQPIGDQTDHSWHDRAVSLRFKVLGGADVEIQVHPQCVAAAAEKFGARFKEHCAELQERSMRPVSWWDKFWGKA